MTIAIFVVISGLLAFKATKFGGEVWLCTSTIAGGPIFCTDGYTTTRGVIITTAYTATTTNPDLGTCPNPAVKLSTAKLRLQQLRRSSLLLANNE